MSSNLALDAGRAIPADMWLIVGQAGEHSSLHCSVGKLIVADGETSRGCHLTNRAGAAYLVRSSTS